MQFIDSGWGVTALSGCISRGQESISEGAAFGAGILREPGATKKPTRKTSMCHHRFMVRRR